MLGLERIRLQYNNVSFGVESSRSRSHVTTINHNFISFGLTSITALGYLRHRVGGTFIYKSEGYSVATDAYQV